MISRFRVVQSKFIWTILKRIDLTRFKEIGSVTMRIRRNRK